MPRITNAILGERLNHVIDSIDDIKEDVKSNTAFRLQFKGMIGLAAGISTALGGVAMLLFERFFGK